jgi:hypothetical protein
MPPFPPKYMSGHCRGGFEIPFFYLVGARWWRSRARGGLNSALHRAKSSNTFHHHLLLLSWCPQSPPTSLYMLNRATTCVVYFFQELIWWPWNIFLTFSWWFLSTTIGMNTWIKLHVRMVAGIRGFNRTWLSYKKKYKAILKEYRNDKRANEISGTDRKQDCR